MFMDGLIRLHKHFAPKERGHPIGSRNYKHPAPPELGGSSVALPLRGIFVFSAFRALGSS